MNGFYGQPDCYYRLRCATKATHDAANLKHPSHKMCSRCPFILRLLDIEAKAAVRRSRNIDVILTQAPDSTEDS